VTAALAILMLAAVLVGVPVLASRTWAAAVTSGAATPAKAPASSKPTPVPVQKLPRDRGQTEQRVPPPRVPSGYLQIYAAASLQNAMLELSNNYELHNPGVHVVSSFGGSAELRGQIEAGALADVFVSADSQHVAALVRGGICDTVRIVGRNQLGVIARKEGPVKTVADLAMPGVRVEICAPDVPAGRYAEAMLVRMEHAKGMGRGFVKRVRANLTGREKSSRAAVTRVAMGDADAALVYVTDLEVSKKKLAPIPVPDSLSVPTLYAAALVKQGKMRVTAADYLRFLLGPTGKIALQHHGMLAP
jgi:molybdate transport system substrate-binding protein